MTEQHCSCVDILRTFKAEWMKHVEWLKSNGDNHNANKWLVRLEGIAMSIERLRQDEIEKSEGG